MYKENPKKLIKMLLELVSEFSKTVGYKFNIQKLCFYVTATNTWKTKIHSSV